MTFKIRDDVFSKKISEALTDYYAQFKSAKKRGALDSLNEQLSGKIQQVMFDYELNKKRHGK